MNATLILALLRQRLSSPARVVLALTFFSFPLLIALAAPGDGLLRVDWLFALVLGGGMVGQDVSSGILSGIFARPIRRAEYALSRWAAVVLGASILVVLQTVVGLAILAMRGAEPDVSAMALKAVAAVLTVAGVSAVLLLFSCWVNGLGDLGIYLVGYMFANLLGIVGWKASWSWLTRGGTELSKFLIPRLDPAQLFSTAFSAFDLASYLSTIVLCLALAIVLLNRKELSYAAG
jgi:ABC-type transport system involved in multi-copper enzyme maturation permease subunit